MSKLRDAINYVEANIEFNKAAGVNDVFCEAAKDCVDAASYKLPLKVIRGSNEMLCANCKNIVHSVGKKKSYCPYCGKAISWVYKVKR